MSIALCIRSQTHSIAQTYTCACEYIYIWQNERRVSLRPRFSRLPIFFLIIIFFSSFFFFFFFSAASYSLLPSAASVLLHAAVVAAAAPTAASVCCLLSGSSFSLVIFFLSNIFFVGLGKAPKASFLGFTPSALSPFK